MPLEEPNQLAQAATTQDSTQTATTPPPPVETTTTQQTADTSTAQTASDMVGLRDALKPILGDSVLSQFQDDQAALQHLAATYRQAQQHQQLAPYAQLYLQHADKFNAWMAQEKAATEKAQAEKAAWWKAPEFNREWLNMVERDDQGNVRVKPGYPPDVAQKLLNALDHQKNFLNDFSFDPISKIKPGIEQIAREMAEQIVQQHLSGYQDHVFANNFIQQNSQWLHQRDQTGNVVMDQATRRPMLTPEGQRFSEYLGQAQQIGIQDVRAQEQYALGLTQRDAALAKLNQQGLQQKGEETKQTFLDTHNPNQSGVTPAPGKSNRPPIGSGTRNLERRMMERMKENGLAAEQKVT